MTAPRPTTQAVDMRSACSTHVEPVMAAERIVESLGDADSVPDLVLAFAGGTHAKHTDKIARELRAGLGPGTLAAVSVSSTAHRSQEVEDSPSIATLALRVPGGEVRAFNYQDLPFAEPDDDDAIDELIEETTIGVDTRAVLLFGDPYSLPAAAFLESLDAALARKTGRTAHGDGPGPVPVVGGMASWAISTGHNTLVRDGRVAHTGGVGVLIDGPIRLDTVVSQGCRPVGSPMVVTDAKKNIIKGLGGRVAVDAIRATVEGLDDADRALLSKGLQVGIVVNEYKQHFGRGDFLLRPVVGIDQTAGAVAIGERIRVGQTIQLHVRDAETASEDLKLTLQAQELYGPVAGGLLVSCSGRGKSLFDRPSQDAGTLHRVMRRLNSVDDDAPADAGPALAGFHAHTEFGPLGGRTRVHSHTATVALFREDRAV